MINFSKEELKYIKENFEAIIEDLNKINIEDYKRYLGNLGIEDINVIKFLLENIDKINTDEELNKKTISACWWTLGQWVFGEYRFTREETATYISDEIWLDIYEKIIDSFDK